MPKHYSEIIIGAGIAGLSYAYKSKSDFLLVEQSENLGGSWNSHSYQNSIYEFGPNSFMNRSSELEEMIDAISFRDQVLSHDFKKSKRYFYQDGKLKPVSPQSLIFGNLLSLKAKLRILGEIFIRNESVTDDESIHEFFARRFGDEFADLAGHALKGIWAGDTKMLSVEAALPFLKDLEKESGSILKTLIKRSFGPRASDQTNKLQTCSFINGMSSFCEALGDYIGREKIRTRAKVKLLDYDGKQYSLELDGEALTCDNLVLATKAYQAAELLETINSDLSEALAAIYYADIELTAVTLPKSLIKPASLDIFNAFGFINASESPLLGTIFSSELFPERNLEDEYLLTSFSRSSSVFASLRRDQSNAEELATILQPYANKTLELSDFKVIDSKTIKRAIPQYNIGYLKIMDRVNQQLDPSLKLLGNYIGGVAFKDAIKNSWCHSEKRRDQATQLFI